MTTDEKGNLKPLMLTELIAAAKTALAEHGDMIVWVETCVPGYEYNEEHSLPVSDAPIVDDSGLASRNGYWRDERRQKAFVVSGA